MRESAAKELEEVIALEKVRPDGADATLLSDATVCARPELPHVFVQAKWEENRRVILIEAVEEKEKVPRCAYELVLRRCVRPCVASTALLQRLG